MAAPLSIDLTLHDVHDCVRVGYSSTVISIADNGFKVQLKDGGAADAAQNAWNAASDRQLKVLYSSNAELQLLEQSLRQPSKHIHFLPVQASKLHVWRLPLELSPPPLATAAAPTVSAGSGAAAAAAVTPKKKVLHPTFASPTIHRSGSKLAVQASSAFSIRHCPLIYQYLPARFNVVFMIGTNASGKSLLIRRWALDLKSRMFDVRPIRTIDKDSATVAYGADKHKPIPLENRDITVLRDIRNGGDKAVQQFTSAFASVMSGRWRVQIDFGNGAGEFGLVFLRVEPDSTTTAFLYGMVSDGVRQVFRLVLQITAAHHLLSGIDVIVLDEPESHLHPALYLNFFQHMLLPLLKQRLNLKIVVATHDFHLTELISTVPEVQPLVVEVTSRRSVHFPGVPADYYSATMPGKGLLDEVLFSTIAVTCRQKRAFLTDKDNSQNRPVFSQDLLLDMTNRRSVVLFCEGGPSSLDRFLYQHMFDPKQVEVRVAAFFGEAQASTNCAEVRQKVVAARKAKNILSLQLPVVYYGLRDTDRNVFVSDNELITLPVAELENLLWHPMLWPLLPRMLQLIEGPPQAAQPVWAEVAKQRLAAFQKHVQKVVQSNFEFYLTEYARAAAEHICSRTRDILPKLKNDSNQVTNMQAALHKLGGDITSGMEPWYEVLRIAKQCAADKKFPDDPRSTWQACIMDQKALDVLVAFGEMARLDQNPDAIRTHAHYLNEKPLADEFCRMVFPGRNITEMLHDADFPAACNIAGKGPRTVLASLLAALLSNQLPNTCRMPQNDFVLLRRDVCNALRLAVRTEIFDKASYPEIKHAGCKDTILAALPAQEP